jgi:hypothetical protein
MVPRLDGDNYSKEEIAEIFGPPELMKEPGPEVDMLDETAILLDKTDSSGIASLNPIESKKLDIVWKTIAREVTGRHPVLVTTINNPYNSLLSSTAMCDSQGAVSLEVYAQSKPSS